jgi:hypothetical protein
VLTVACVNHGNYLHRGGQYVATLAAMVKRHMRQPYEFRCLTDVGPWGGWWSKIALFEPGRFTGRVLYLDLDSVVVGGLDELASTTGIIDLTDWGWPTRTYCSAVMSWDAGEHDDIYTRFDTRVMRGFRGDQDWITSLGGWKPLPAHICRSYRYVSVKAPPPYASVVQFHGEPKPHQVVGGWVAEHWRP